jgi:hypothetical protein
MAFVEAACVAYLREAMGRLVAEQQTVAPLWRTEVAREVATVVMLAAAGFLAGATWPSRLGYGLVAFGLWDVFYYVFLRVLLGWPASPWDLDALFAIPLPWWGPVVAPISIALLLVLGGTVLVGGRAWPRGWTWMAGIAGVAVGLYVFMADAIHALPLGWAEAQSAAPTPFRWGLFAVALALMSVPIADGLRARR